MSMNTTMSAIQVRDLLPLGASADGGGPYRGCDAVGGVYATLG